GEDPKDTTSVERPVPDYEQAIGRSVRDMRIGIPKEYRVDGMPAEIEALWANGADWLKAAGAEIGEVSLPHTTDALPAYYIVAPADAVRRIRRRREVFRRSGRDVSERRVHRHGEHGGSARHLGSGRARPQWAAARTAADRPAVR